MSVEDETIGERLQRLCEEIRRLRAEELGCRAEKHPKGYDPRGSHFKREGRIQKLEQIKEEITQLMRKLSR